MSTWSEFPSKALWTASIITQMPSMPPTASLVTGPALRCSASHNRLRFGPAAPRTQRTSRSKTAPKKLSTTYQTSQRNVHRTTPKPAEESILNVPYLSAIQVCRTAFLGGHLEQCDQCGHQRNAYNSCGNRHCPKANRSPGLNGSRIVKPNF